MWSAIEKARLRREDGGLVPEGPGWFIVNVADAHATESERFGASARLEGEQRFPEFAINEATAPRPKPRPVTRTWRMPGSRRPSPLRSVCPGFADRLRG